MKEPLKIAVGLSDTPWDGRLATALDEKRSEGYPLRYDLINIETQDWLERLRPYDVVIWAPANMGVESALHFKEKVYVLEKHLGKLVVPNYDTVWHFESKVAQSYLLAIENVPRPATTVTFDHHEALQIDQLKLPLVFKKGEGSGSRNVRLVKDQRTATRLLRNAFCSQIYREAKLQAGSFYRVACRAFWKRWFWDHVWLRCRKKESAGYVYFQEFLSANTADLRIEVIGNRYVYGFWRNNRPNDFRASGSGRLDFDRPIPEEAVRLCVTLSRRLNFDSMAYDLLFKDDQLVISEISYGYLDTAPYRASGHYDVDSDGSLRFVSGHVWPEALWVEWALQRWEKQSRESATARNLAGNKDFA